MWISGKGSSPEDGRALNSLTRAVVTAPRLPDSTLRHRVGLLSSPLQGQESDLLILVGPF